MPAKRTKKPDEIIKDLQEFLKNFNINDDEGNDEGNDACNDGENDKDSQPEDIDWDDIPEEYRKRIKTFTKKRRTMLQKENERVEERLLAANAAYRERIEKLGRYDEKSEGLKRLEEKFLPYNAEAQKESDVGYLFLAFTTKKNPNHCAIFYLKKISDLHDTLINLHAGKFNMHLIFQHLIFIFRSKVEEICDYSMCLSLFSCHHEKHLYLQ